LFRLFRPEFVKKNEFPLNSDAFSKFGRHDSEVHQKEIEIATKK
jgi:hypothetical protein